MKKLQRTSLLVCFTILVLFGSAGIVAYWPAISQFLASSAGIPAGSGQTGADPFAYDPPLPSYVKDLHPKYTIQAELHTSEAKITGKMTLEFDNPKTKDLRLYIYDYLWNRMTVKSVRYKDKPLAFDRGSSTVTLANPFGAEVRGALTIEFDNPVPRRGTRFGVKDDIWTLTTWYPMLGAQNQQGKWYDPPLRIDYGDPFVYHYADYDVSFISPQGYNWVSSWGRGTTTALDGNRQQVRYQGNKLLNFALVGSPLYHIETVKLGPNLAVDIASVDKGNIERIKTIAESAFPTYADWYGPLPYPHVAIAETSTGTTYAMEYANMAIFKRDMYQRNLIDHWLPHEIAHLWWYNSVATLEASHGWLDEGLVEISVFHYLQNRYDNQSAATLLDEYRRDGQRLMGRYPDGKLDKPLQKFATEEEFHWTWYSRGALLFDNLRRQIGDEAYKGFLHRVQQNYHGSVIGAEHLDQALGQTLQGEAVYFRKYTQASNATAFGPVQLEPYVTTIINGMSFYPQIPARVMNGTAYIPLRDVGEHMGMRVEWSKEKQMIRVAGNGREIYVKEGDPFAIADGKRLDLGHSVLSVKDRVLVPMSFFHQAIGLETEYDAAKRTVKIMTRKAGKAAE
ncbi:stalk domain-containing protein [Brevibacillus brevis]|uniref:Stalk domain-containing protein n=1 Tax=Brevibacillus brevis TaxID=1393 RepID=A0ABY9TAF7_BREBE|nr:stalk domain-containing protein [Brevibacillus brevis]WNC17093.1 stalk domain-containing protein [Brevibacillus brevis]